jgi:hypothetical protein
MLAYWNEKIAGTTVRARCALAWRQAACGRRAACAACDAPRSPQARMLDIIPYVSVTVRVQVLLFKPRVGAEMGARAHAPRRAAQTLRRRRARCAPVCRDACHAPRASPRPPVSRLARAPRSLVARRLALAAHAR